MSSPMNDSFETDDIIEAEHIKQIFEPLRDLEEGQAFFREDIGSANDYKVDFSGSGANKNEISAYKEGQLIVFKASNANTGASYLQVVGPSGDLSALPLTKSGNAALVAGDIQAGQMVAVVYNDAGRFEMVGAPSQGGGGPVVPDGFFGDGSDGDLTLTGFMTLSSSHQNLNNLTISGAGNLNVRDLIIFVNGVLDLTNAGAGAIRTLPNGSQPWLLQPTMAVRPQGAGGNTVGSQAGVADTHYMDTYCLGGFGGAGGAGGNGTSGMGGASMIQTMLPYPYAPGLFQSWPMSQTSLTRHQVAIAAAGGASSGSGGGGNGSSAGGAGGLSQRTAGLIIYAREIKVASSTATGCISAKSAAGGHGGAAGGTNRGGGGGGGGAGGGFVYIYAGKIDGYKADAIDVSGSNGGNGGNGGGGTTGTGGHGGGGGGAGVCVIYDIARNKRTHIKGNPLSTVTVANSGTTGGTGNAGRSQFADLGEP